MANINVRARGNGGISDALAARRKREEQLGRQRVVIPKPKPSAAGGAMQGFTRATGTASWSVGGVRVTDWTFDASVDQSPAAKPGLVMGGDSLHFGVTAAGWYSTHAQMQFTLSSGSPAAVLFQANNGSMNLAPFGETWGHLHFDGRYRASFWCGPFWLDVDSSPLGLEAYIPGAFTPGSVLATFVDVWRVG